MPRDPDACPRCGLLNNPGQEHCDSCGSPMNADAAWSVEHHDTVYLLRGLSPVFWRVLVVAVLGGAAAIAHRLAGN